MVHQNKYDEFSKVLLLFELVTHLYGLEFKITEFNYLGMINYFTSLLNGFKS